MMMYTSPLVELFPQLDQVVNLRLLPNLLENNYRVDISYEI